MVEGPLPGHDADESKRRLDCTLAPDLSASLAVPVPAGLQEAAMAAIEPDPDHRHRTPAEFKVALLDVL